MRSWLADLPACRSAAWCAAGCATLALSAASGASEPPGVAQVAASRWLRVEAGVDVPGLPFLGWDTEGGPRAATNLLRAPVTLRARAQGQSRPLPGRLEGLDRGGARYVLRSGTAEMRWAIRPAERGLVLEVARSEAAGAGAAEGAFELVFPFELRVTPTTLLPSEWLEGGAARLPAVLSAPDHGQMRLSAEGGERVRARFEGSRTAHSADLAVEFTLAARSRRPFRLRFEPAILPAPAGVTDLELWRGARRGWFGALQCSARWGEAGNPFSAPAGMLANNVVSDPASCSLWFYADQAFWTPWLARGVSAMNLVRRTLDWWLDSKILPDGEMICYWDKAHFLDANAGPLIAAWDYVEIAGDRAWLRERIERLEFIADYLVRRDVDGDGLVEAVQSGNLGTLVEPGRSCAWWDAINCGHKDAYSNALVYRAWRCLADLEAKLQRPEAAARYAARADRLKAAYAPALLNPATGWLAWWRSADQRLHDYAAPTVNGLAIEYGLVTPAQGREILGRLRKKMAEVGFTRLDLGIPSTLVPVPRQDYLLPDGAGSPRREDGTDTFGYYMNGGISAGQALHFIAAHYVVGVPTEGDRVLRAMLGRQAAGAFQNGAVNAYPKGIDWTTWDGRPAGYEGYLADSFRFLQAVPLREAAARARFYRPLGAAWP